ncbi:hypothetical protein SteCoe_33956 [Stentor coeruleus]|uniref:Uncharacterized protein n=1 Tax=Stentor coeruleus TaxID=5963 RepID=A0A1R2AVJ4_9CILI|nr:hypothetical protein SteCoe_33956 [Stentor coeruleus]
MFLALLALGVYAIGVKQGFLQPDEDYAVLEYHEMRVLDKDSGIEEVTIYQKSQKADKGFGPEGKFLGQGALGMDKSFDRQDMPRDSLIGGLESSCRCADMGGECGCADMGGECGCHDKDIQKDIGIFGGPMTGKDDEECHEGCPFGFGSDNQSGLGGEMNGFIPPDIFQGNSLAAGPYNEGMKGGFDHGHEDWDTENCPFGGVGHKQDSLMGNNGMMGPGPSQGNVIIPDPMILMGGSNEISDPMNIMGENNIISGSQNANDFKEYPFEDMAGSNTISGYPEDHNSMMDTSSNSLLGPMGENFDANDFSNQELITQDQYSLDGYDDVEELFSDINLDDLKEDIEGEDLGSLMDMMEDFMETFEDKVGFEGFSPSEDAEEKSSECCNDEEDIEEILGNDYDELIIVVADDEETEEK